MHQFLAMRLFSLVLFIAFSSLNSFSQSIPMLGLDVVWRERLISSYPAENFSYNRWTDGDTLINDTLYYNFYCNWEDSFVPEMEGYIREDSGKVYIRISEEQIGQWCIFSDYNVFNIDQDHLLFDTSAEEGDTIEVWFSRQTLDPPYIAIDTINRVLIENIDTLFLGGMDRRVFYYDDIDFGWGGNWIEGIGSDGGLMHPWCEIGYGREPHLVCYSVNDSTIYGGLSNWNCDDLDNIEEYTMNNQVSIVPNPSDRYIMIQNEYDSNGRYDIMIYDLKAREFIMQEDLTLESRIDISKLSSGMYFIHIQFEDGGKAVKKFVKK